MNIDEIFNVPNTEENYMKKEEIINQFKKERGIPEFRGVNICEVIKWAEDNCNES